LGGRDAEQPGERDSKANASVNYPGKICPCCARQVLQCPRAGRNERTGAEHASDEAQNYPCGQSVKRAHGGRGHDDAG
jgi:hypothetical protein